MMEILKTDKQEVMSFNEPWWDKINDVHFGKGIRWNTTEFAYKAVEGSDVVGLIFGKHESGTIYVSNIIVREDKRRQGIGTVLLKRAEEFGKQFGDHKIWLISGKHYSEDPFFKKLGFKEEAFLPNLYFHEDFLVYTKNI